MWLSLGIKKLLHADEDLIEALIENICSSFSALSAWAKDIAEFISSSKVKIGLTTLYDKEVV